MLNDLFELLAKSRRHTHAFEPLIYLYFLSWGVRGAFFLLCETKCLNGWGSMLFPFENYVKTGELDELFG